MQLLSERTYPHQANSHHSFNVVFFSFGNLRIRIFLVTTICCKFYTHFWLHLSPFQPEEQRLLQKPLIWSHDNWFIQFLHWREHVFPYLPWGHAKNKKKIKNKRMLRSKFILWRKLYWNIKTYLKTYDCSFHLARK